MVLTRSHRLNLTTIQANAQMDAAHARASHAFSIASGQLISDSRSPVLPLLIETALDTDARAMLASSRVPRASPFPLMVAGRRRRRWHDVHCWRVQLASTVLALTEVLLTHAFRPRSQRLLFSHANQPISTKNAVIMTATAVASFILLALCSDHLRSRYRARVAHRWLSQMILRVRRTDRGFPSRSYLHSLQTRI